MDSGSENRGFNQVPVGGCYRLIDTPISNCINNGINKIFFTDSVQLRFPQLSPCLDLPWNSSELWTWFRGGSGSHSNCCRCRYEVVPRDCRCCKAIYLGV